MILVGWMDWTLALATQLDALVGWSDHTCLRWFHAMLRTWDLLRMGAVGWSCMPALAASSTIAVAGSLDGIRLLSWSYGSWMIVSLSACSMRWFPGATYCAVMFASPSSYSWTSSDLSLSSMRSFGWCPFGLKKLNVLVYAALYDAAVLSFIGSACMKFLYVVMSMWLYPLIDCTGNSMGRSELEVSHSLQYIFCSVLAAVFDTFSLTGGLNPVVLDPCLYWCRRTCRVDFIGTFCWLAFVFG